MLAVVVLNANCGSFTEAAVRNAVLSLLVVGEQSPREPAERSTYDTRPAERTVTAASSASHNHQRFHSFAFARLVRGLEVLVGEIRQMGCLGDILGWCYHW